MLNNLEDMQPDYEMLDRVFAQGINTFDNAHVYGGGRSDVIFGNWVQKRGIRDQLVIIGKGSHHNEFRKRVTPFDLEADIADTLARMQLPSLDMWMFHRDDPQQAIGPLVEACQQAIDAGHISTWGVSNWQPARIQLALDYAKKYDLTGPVASSPNYSLAEQIESPWGDDCVTISGPRHQDDRAWYENTQLPLFSWSSLARGFLSGRLSRANHQEAGSQFGEDTLRCYACEDNWQRLERASQLAEEKGYTLPQIALAFVLGSPMHLHAIISSYTQDEVTANVAALDIELSQAERDWIDLKADRP